MARIRTIKPEFWDHKQLGRCSPLARLTFAGLISLADDEGRGRAEVDWLWGRLHSGQHPNVRRVFPGALSELRRLRDEDGPLVLFYKVAGAAYYCLTGFKRQQRIDKASESKLPSPPDSKNVPRTLQDHSTLDQVSGSRDQVSGIKDQGGGGESAGLVKAFAFCRSPGQQAKTNAIEDLLRQGVDPGRIMAYATSPEHRTWDFWEIIKAIKSKSPKSGLDQFVEKQGATG